MSDTQVLNRNHRGGDTTDADDTDSDHDLAKRMNERQNRPASIDMALSLERELDDENEYDASASAQPSTSRETSHSGDQELRASSASTTDSNRRVSLDAQVLQHIITNLRSELARAQSERDALAEALEGAPTREAELREALGLLTEKSAATEAELERLKRKSQDDEDAIAMLRTKLEESRRALMRLQTESKRMSQMSHMSVDTSRANALFGGGPNSSKRASFTPLTGSGALRVQSHRRISSISEPSFAFDPSATEPPSPPGAGHAISWSGGDDANAKKARRSSAFFGGMPVSMGLARSATPSPPTQSRQLVENGFHADQTAQELEALRKERDTVRAELTAAQQELSEAQEAREASEQCVAALRSFIAAQSEAPPDSEDGNITSGILKLPPLPTEKNVDESTAVSQATPLKKGPRPSMGAGWSFGKLFRAEATGPTSGASPAESGGPGAKQVTPDIQTSVPRANSGNASHSPSPSTATPGGAFSRTFGGFFTGRAPSITSIGSVTSPNGNSNSNAPNNSKSKAVVPPIAHGQQEPTLNGLGSDDEDEGVEADAEDSIESTTGPLSPNTSREVSSEEIWIRNASSSSSAGSELGAMERERVSVEKSAIALKEEERRLEKDISKSVQKEKGAERMEERVERESSSIC